MKNRSRQRAALMNKLKERVLEEMLEYRDCCGVPDPTPYEAIRNCVRREQRTLSQIRMNESD
jgi:hypothetical protein